VIVDFNIVWQEYEKELTAFVKTRLFDKSFVADIMQEIAIKIYKHQNQLKHIDNIRAWTYRITRNTLIDFYKQNDKVIPDELYVLDLRTVSDGSNDNELSSCIMSMSNSLEQKDKDILNLSIFEQYSVAELSSKFKLSPEGAKTKLKRAKKKLANSFFTCCTLEKDTKGKIIDFTAIDNKRCKC